MLGKCTFGVCRIDDRFGVKITDSALARDIFPLDYHCLGDGLNRAVKWLSPESLAWYRTEPAGDVVSRFFHFSHGC